MRNNKTSNSLTAFICVVSTSTNAATITNIITIAADDAYQASKCSGQYDNKNEIKLRESA